MIKKGLFILISLGILSGGLVLAAAENISNSSYPSEDACIAINSSGEIGVVWVERISTSRNSIYYSIRRSGRWSSPAGIPGQSANNAYPCISRGPNGGFVAAWHDQSVNCIRFSQYSGSSWSTPVTVSQVGGFQLSWPTITTTTNGRVAVGWMRGNNVYHDIFVNILRSGGWSGIVNVSNTRYSSKYPDLNYGPSGQIYVVWQDNLYNEATGDDWQCVMINNDQGSGTWGKSSYVNDLKAWCFRPVVAVNSQNDVLSCFYYHQAKSYWSSSRLNGRWDDPKCISDIGGHKDHDRYISDACPYGSSRFLYIYRDCGFNIFYKIVQDGNSGKANALTNSDQCYHPSIDYSSSVGAAASWTDFSKNSDVFVSIFDPGNEEPEPEPEPEPEKVVMPPLGAEANYLNIPLAALNLKTERVVNRNLFTVQYFNRITWGYDANWNNWNISLSKYRIFRKLKTSASWVFLAEVSPSVLLYIDKNGISAEDRYDYHVRGVDNLGNDFYAYNWIRWAPNPANAEQEITIKNYKIYRKQSGQPDSKYAVWKTVSASTNSQEDHSTEIRQNIQYAYALTAVSSEDKESELAEAKKIIGSAFRFSKQQR